MTTFEEALASTLRGLRESKGFSLREVGGIVDSSPSAVMRWETPGANGRTPPPTTLAAVSAVYETTPAALYASAQKVADAGLDEVRRRARALEVEINERHGR